MSKDFSTFLKTLSKQRPGTIAISILLFIAVAILGLWMVSELIAKLVVEGFWFNEVGYPETFWVRLLTKALIGAVVAGFSLFFLFSNLRLANRLQHLVVPPPAPKPQTSNLKPQTSNLKPPAPALSLRWVLSIAIVLSLLIGLLLVHYSQIVTNFSQFAASQPGTTPIIPNRFRLDAIFPLTQHLATKIGILSYLEIAVLGAGIISLLAYPKMLLKAIALILSLEWSFVLSANWNQLLLFLHAIPFKRVDPIFSKDIGFYIFSLPTWQLLEFWLMGLSLFAFLAVSLRYLLSANSLSEGIFPGFSHSQIRHLSGLAGCLMLAISFSYWVSRYELLYSPRGVVFGAGYTDAHVQLPACTVMAILACAIALFLFWLATKRQPRGRGQVLSSQVSVLNSQFQSQLKTQNSKLKTRREAARANLKSKIPLPFLLLSGYLVLAIALTIGLPMAVQRTIVQPNELTREQPYIRNSIAATRGAFNLENVQQETFNPVGNLTSAALQENNQTIRNIRLWDTRPLLQTNRQLQQIRPYYRFSDADIDRYALQSEVLTAPNQPAPPTPNNQQVLISARELDYTAVPKEAQTWVNEHLVYTHGYGFTLSPVNKVAPGGLPDYFVKDIGPDPNNPAQNLTVSNEAIRTSIPIGHPRLYYGEITDTYVLTDTQIKELDFPSGNDNIYNVYNGDGGIKVAPLWKRWLFARYLQDWEMVLTKYFTPQTKLLLRRNINERVRAIAPFLRYDQDPYLVVADPGFEKPQNSKLGTEAIHRDSSDQNYLYWMIDAYTLSDHYPYSDPTQLAASRTKSSDPGGAGMERSDRFNYIRNSVKVVVDAYHGSVNFYVADPSDPIIQAWTRIFPHLFKPLSQMPAALQSHIRYPIDLFSAQSERLMRYHMTDPQVFYNQEDLWQIPNEIYGSQPQPVEPYFLITNLPTVVEGEEFILLLPYTPRQRTNLTAWLAARSDGANYGKLLLYVFPKQQLVFGTEQIEARINQDPVISQKISLWNRQGSRAIQGNLLVIPIEQSLLYVEPLYLEAEQNSLPTLVSVIVAYENRIAMTESLEQSLQAIFQPVQPAIPAIVRPVE